MTLPDGAAARGRPALRAVLVDLDDTLFDHAHATKSALGRLRADEPTLGHWSLEELLARHDEILEDLHVRVLDGALTIDQARRERFTRLLRAAGAERAVDRAAELALAYRREYQVSWRAVPGARTLLDALQTAGLRTVVVTNNGVDEQRLKLDRCDLAPLVDALVTSEEVGHSKPAEQIFRVALGQARASAEETVMLGDAWPTDIEGARRSGIRPVWLNRKGATSPDDSVQEVRSLEPVDRVLDALFTPPAVRL